MAEYIKKWPVVDKLIALENELQRYKPFIVCEAKMYGRICDIEIEIGKTPASDVAPVVHGRWEETLVPDGYVQKASRVRKKCSVCGWTNACRYKYCPNCGAKMDLEE